MATFTKPIWVGFDTDDRHIIQRGFRCAIPMARGTAEALMESADLVVDGYLRKIAALQDRNQTLAGGAEWDNRRRQVR